MSMNVMTTAAAGMALSLALLATGAAGAQTKRAAAPMPAAGGGPLAMDVAGVRLGMPLDAAEAALTGAYACRRERGFETFQQKVDWAVGKRRGGSRGLPPQGTGVGLLTCRGPSGEYLTINLALTSAGAVVDRMNLSVSGERVDMPSLLRQVESKYGRPTTGTPANGSWCSARCGNDLDAEAGPMIKTISGGSDLRILASRGRLARDADAAAVRTAVDRAAPVATRGAF